MPLHKVEAGKLCSRDLHHQSRDNMYLHTSLVRIYKQQRMASKNADTKLSITFFKKKSLC